MTTDTPRTDAEEVQGFLYADFARQLERDLTSAVKLLAQFNTLRMTEDKSLSEQQWLEYCRLYRDYSK